MSAVNVETAFTASPSSSSCAQVRFCVDFVRSVYPSESLTHCGID